MIRTYQRAILGRLGGRKWDDLGGLGRGAELTRGFHHGAASLQSIIAPVGGRGRPAQSPSRRGGCRYFAIAMFWWRAAGRLAPPLRLPRVEHDAINRQRAAPHERGRGWHKRFACDRCLTQVPLNSFRSISATFIPASVNRPARDGPSCPAPIMIASKSWLIAPLPRGRRDRARTHQLLCC